MKRHSQRTSKSAPTNGRSSGRAFRQTVLYAVVAISAAAAVYFGMSHSRSEGIQPPAVARGKNPFDAKASYAYLKHICALGPRQSGSDGMAAQQRFLVDHFKRLGAEVKEQLFTIRHPEKGTPLTLKNLIIQWHPDRKERILLCTHYDTRPFPDQERDPRRRKGVFIGANDGASGVALFCELGKHMPKLKCRYGVDFVLFDGEEFIFDRYRDRDLYFLGSKHFAKSYVSEPPQHKYRMGVLVDMVADRELHLFEEVNSLRHARWLVKDIWATARRLGVSEFVARHRHEIRDDHLPLNQIAKIPTIDIIDYDYPRPGARPQYWHTQHDTVRACSGESLAKVGWVLLEWLKQVE